MPRVVIKGSWTFSNEEEVIDDYDIPDEEWEKMSDFDKDKFALEAIMDFLDLSVWVEVIDE